MKKILIFNPYAVATSHHEVALELALEYKKQGYEVFGIYEDVGVSGVSKIKPARERLLEDIQKGKINKVCVFSICRISRSVSDLCSFIDTLGKLNCSLFVLTQNIDTDTSFGKTMFHFVSIISDFEREMLRERIKSGIEVRKKQGLSVGRKSNRSQGMTEAIKIMIRQNIGVRETLRKLQIGTKYYYEVVQQMKNESIIVQ